MGKPVRIYQLARELNVESKQILQLLNEKMNIDINNHMSAINDQVAAKIRLLMKGKDPDKESPRVNQDKPKPKEPVASAAPPAASQTEKEPERRSEEAVALGNVTHEARPAPVQGTRSRDAAPSPHQRMFPPRKADKVPGAAGGPGGNNGPVGNSGYRQGTPVRSGQAKPGYSHPGYGQQGKPTGRAQGAGFTARPTDRPGFGGGERGPRQGAPGGRPGGPGAGYNRPPVGGGQGRPPAGQGRYPARPGGQGGPGGRPGGPGGAPGGRPSFQGKGAVAGARPGMPAPTIGKPTGRPGGGKPWEKKRNNREKEEEVSLAKLRRGNVRDISQGRRDREKGQAGVSEITITGPITVGDLAQELKVSAGEVITKLMNLGFMATINQQIDVDTAAIVSEEMGAKVDIKEPEEEPTDEELLQRITEGEAPETLKLRPPVVTVMGHVDHGKTTLLDAIRETKVVSTEAGGITQHIGAYAVEADGRKIVFLDTPGHEAFTAMRARGARVTDIAILVVAADDGVKPQTIEALNHAREAKVPVIVAVNKIDKPGANPDRVKQQLSEHGLIPEEWGGDTVYVPVSALRKEGIDHLLEIINLVADMKDLKANPDRPAVGTIVEARLDRGRGPVATVLIQAGTLRLGDPFIAGVCFGKVRAMMDDTGEMVEQAGPSIPVEVLGFDDVPQAGDIFRVVGSERIARSMAGVRRVKRREEDIASKRVISLVEFQKRLQDGEEKELKVIVKADVQGSLEALRGALEKIQNEEVRVSIVHGAVGGITESDVMLAAASGAVIMGFNVRPDGRARDLANLEGVEIKTYRVIYDALEDVRAALTGLLAPKIEEEVIGRADVRATFRVPGAGTVAGLYVTEGKMQRNARVRLVRDGVVVHEGTISSLKRFKDDAREVSAGFECGLGIDRFNDVKVGDLIECFVEKEVGRELITNQEGSGSLGV